MIEAIQGCYIVLTHNVIETHSYTALFNFYKL